MEFTFFLCVEGEGPFLRQDAGYYCNVHSDTTWGKKGGRGKRKAVWLGVRRAISRISTVRSEREGGWKQEEEEVEGKKNCMAGACLKDVSVMAQQPRLLCESPLA